MAAIWRGTKQYEIVFENDKYNRHIYNRETDDYGSYFHEAGRASSLKSAKAIISRTRKEDAENHPHNFKVLDCFGDDGEGFAPCVYTEE